MHMRNRNLQRRIDAMIREGHLDQGESAFFLRGLEDVDRQAYMRRFPSLLARQVIPTFMSVAAWASVYTWREWTPVGSAKIIANAADDLPMNDVTGQEFSQMIKDVGNGYMYSLKEIKKSAADGTPLDATRAEMARMTTEQLIDQILATGNATNKLQGVLSLDSTALPASSRVTTFTFANKAASGTKAWGTLAAPVATGKEVAADLIGIASKIVEDTKGIWSQVNIVLPIAQYNYAASTTLNAINNTTALEFALKSGFISSIRPWYMCAGAGAAGADRLAAFPSDPIVLGGIVPQEWTPMPPQQKNLAYIVNAVASVGGVVCRYPIACRYGDGL
jgi:hypothetical protein